ncbi:MAG: nicotinate (nicotinamide) nucleotide adenylyltransferase [Oscillospiraceae bacterium]|nr:nicotinate (nicotinamide) nucleotide adenylyltransferase [Oscillospiraceae bacterium]
MKICFFGGTFNPVHNGHIRLLENASKHFAFDKIIVIPTNIPPHKEVIFSVSDDDRLTMCKLAFDGMAEVSDYEIRENTISYTINTIHHFKEIYPDDEFYFLMGSDMLFMFEKWKNYKELISLISIVVASREDDEMSSVEKKKLELEEDGAKIYIIKAEPYVVSSSLIRDKIKSGEKDFSCYLPERVVEYILEKKLYLE